jgi:hypothetical protein
MQCSLWPRSLDKSFRIAMGRRCKRVERQRVEAGLIWGAGRPKLILIARAPLSLI